MLYCVTVNCHFLLFHCALGVVPLPRFLSILSCFLLSRSILLRHLLSVFKERSAWFRRGFSIVLGSGFFCFTLGYNNRKSSVKPSQATASYCLANCVPLSSELQWVDLHTWLVNKMASHWMFDLVFSVPGASAAAFSAPKSWKILALCEENFLDTLDAQQNGYWCHS